MHKRSVYFSALLPERFSDFFTQLSGILDHFHVSWGLLPHTKDIWCRDYMPVLRPAGTGRSSVGATDSFVLFKYNPSYLKHWRHTITDATLTCRKIGVEHRSYELVVDGGNIVRLGRKAIMTEQVYCENPRMRKSEVHAMLMDLLNVDELIMIPVEPGDPYGHADGCVRFVNKDMVLIHKTLPENKGFSLKLRQVLEKHGLKYVELPYFFENDPKYKESAVGNYINFLKVRNLILVPSYAGHEELNRQAVDVLQRAFGRAKEIVAIESTVVAKEGGILNCVSWN